MEYNSITDAVLYFSHLFYDLCYYCQMLCIYLFSESLSDLLYRFFDNKLVALVLDVIEEIPVLDAFLGVPFGLSLFSFGLITLILVTLFKWIRSIF